MNIIQNKSLKDNARNLRKNMTKEERKLWYEGLREYEVKFRRQQIVGDYIVDFYCDKAKLAIELDGSQHYEEEIQKKDKERTAYIESQGIKVVRFSNADINQRFQAVCDVIHNTVLERIKLLPPVGEVVTK